MKRKQDRQIFPGVMAEPYYAYGRTVWFVRDIDQCWWATDRAVAGAWRYLKDEERGYERWCQAYPEYYFWADERNTGQSSFGRAVRAAERWIRAAGWRKE